MSEESNILKQISDMRLKGSKLKRVPRNLIKDRSRAVIPKAKPKDLPERPELPERVSSTYTGAPEPSPTTYDHKNFDKTATKKHFECPTCTKFFSVKNVPKLVECGDSMCQECILEMTNQLAADLTEYHCQICGDMHAVPEFKVFKNNKFLLKLLKLPYFPPIPKDEEAQAIKEIIRKDTHLDSKKSPEQAVSSEIVENPEPTKNPEPEETQEPEKTPEPKETQEPEETPEPKETQEPEETQGPIEILEPRESPDILKEPESVQAKKPKDSKKKTQEADNDFGMLIERTISPSDEVAPSAKGSSKLTQLEFILTSKGLNKAMEYCEDMRTEVEWCTELGVGTISKVSEVLIKRINDFEAECTKNLSDQISMIHDFDEKWKGYLAECGVDEKAVEAAAAELLEF